MITLETLREWGKAWLTAEPVWRQFQTWDDAAGEYRLAGLVRLRNVAWLLESGRCTFREVAPLLWACLGQLDPAAFQAAVPEALWVGRHLTPAIVRSVLGIHENAGRHLDDMSPEELDAWVDAQLRLDDDA